MAANSIVKRFKKGDIEFDYEIVLSSRRTATIEIGKVSKRLVVRLPLRASLSLAETLIAGKIDWVLKHLNSVVVRGETFKPRSYESGSIHLYLGDRYTLEVVIGDLNSVKIVGSMDGVGRKIVVTSRHASIVKDILRLWYKAEAHRVIIPICSKMSNAFYNRHKVSPISIEFKYIKSYWGLCTSKRVIRFNIDLIRAPVECIQSIVAHELCHLVHQNHSKGFYDLLTSEFSQWKECQEYLSRTISTRD